MNHLLKPLTIGGVTLENNLILAPMAGVTDLPFRLLCSEQGAALTGMEMVSAKAIMYGNKNTEALLAIHPQEGLVSLQLFGSDPKIVSEMAKRIEERPFAILDINMGCPVPKVVNNGEGSALMKNPELAGKIVKAVSGRIKKPVTVKFRKGFNDSTVNAVDFAKRMEENGALAIAVHGRTREEYYSGKADWEIIARVKEAVTIPVFASGDIFTVQDAVRCEKETSCDGLMLARGARGNPWLFHQIKTYQQTGVLEEKPNLEEVIQMILRHARMQAAFKGEYLGIREMRKHVAWYIAGYKNSASIRRRVNEVENLQQLEELFQEWRGNMLSKYEM